MDFFVKRNGKVNGPFTLAQIKSGIKQRKLKTSDDFCNSSDGPWKKLSPKFIRLVTSDDKQADEVDPFDMLPDKSKQKATQDVAKPNSAEPIEYAEPEPDPPVQEPEPATPAPKKLIECPDCGGTVSRRAKACIHCGAPLQAEPTPAPVQAASSQQVHVITDAEPFVVQTWDSRGAPKLIDSDSKLYDDEAIARLRFNTTGTCVVAAGPVLTDVNGNEYFMHDEMGHNLASGNAGEAFSVNVDVHHRNWVGLPFRVKVYSDIGDVPVCRRPPLTLKMIYRGVTGEVKEKMNGWLGWKGGIFKMAIGNGVSGESSESMSVTDEGCVSMENTLNKHLAPKIMFLDRSGGLVELLDLDAGFGDFGAPMNWTCHVQCTKAEGLGYFDSEKIVDHPNIGEVDGEYRFKKLDVVRLR